MAIMTTVVKGGADAWGKLTEENKKVIATAAKENMPLFEDLLKKSGINPELATKILTEIKGRVANMSTAPAPAKDAEFKLTTKNSPVTADGKTTIKTTYEVQVGDGKPPVKLMFDPKTKELKSEDPSISVSKDDKGKITITKMPLAPMTIDNAKLQAEVDKLEAARGAAPAGPATPAPAAPAPEKPAAGMPLAEIEKELAAEMTKMQTAKTALDTSKKALQDALAAKPPVEANITKALDEYETKVKASKDPMTKSTKRVNELATEGEKVAAEPKKAAFGMVKAQTANANPMSEYETLLDEERKKRPKGAAPDAPAAGVGGGDNWFKKLFDVIGAIVSGDMKRVEDILRGGPAAAAPAPAAPGAGTPPAGAKPADPAKPAAPGTSAVTRTAASQGIPDDQLEAIEIAELTSQRLQVENPTMEPAKAAEQGKAAGQEAMKDAALLEATGEGQGKKFLADKVEEAKASLEAAKAKAPPAPVKPVEPEKPKMPKVVFREGKDGKVDRATIVKLNKRLLVDAKTKVALENPDLKPNSPEFNAKVMETWKSVAEEVIREAAKGGTTVTVADVAKGAENRLALMEAEIDLRKALTARENAKDSVRTPEAIKAVVDKEVKETMEKARMGEGLTGTPAIDYVKTDTNKAVSETAKLETDKAFAEMNSTPEKKALLDAYRESIVKVAKANPLITDPEAFADRAVQMTVKDLAKMTPDQVKATVTKNEQKAVEIKAKVEAKMNSPEIQADRAKIVEDAGKRDVGAVVQDTAKLTSDMGAAMDAVKKMMADGDFKFAVASKDGGKEISMKDVGGLSAPVAGGGGAPEPTAER